MRDDQGISDENFMQMSPVAAMMLPMKNSGRKNVELNWRKYGKKLVSHY
jgi:hypothetical protein